MTEREDSCIAGTKIGGAKAAATNKARHGASFYAMIGRKGGQNGNTGGFAANRELARAAGRKAGKISKRGHTFMHTEGQYNVYIANDTGKVVKYKHGNNYFEGERGIAR